MGRVLAPLRRPAQRRALLFQQPLRMRGSHREQVLGIHGQVESPSGIGTSMVREARDHLKWRYEAMPLHCAPT